MGENLDSGNYWRRITNAINETLGGSVPMDPNMKFSNPSLRGSWMPLTLIFCKYDIEAIFLFEPHTRTHALTIRREMVFLFIVSIIAWRRKQRRSFPKECIFKILSDAKRILWQKKIVRKLEFSVPDDSASNVKLCKCERLLLLLRWITQMFLSFIIFRLKTFVRILFSILLSQCCSVSGMCEMFFFSLTPVLPFC